MKRFVVAALLATSSTFTFAADQQCLANKYDAMSMLHYNGIKILLI